MSESKPHARVAVGDIVAGLSVALVLVPQALAYAELAGLPPRHGLYAAALPPIAAAFFASSPYLQTGPVAMTSLLTFGALSFAAGTAEYVGLAALLALVVGAARVLIGLARAGWIAYLMSRPVLTGFAAAAAILIVASQLPTALGVEAPAGDLLVRAWWAARHADSWEPTSIVLSLITAAVIVAGRRVHALFPGVLVAVIIGVIYSSLSSYAGPVVGEIPASPPPISLALPWSSLPLLIIPGGVIALVGFAEASAVARSFAAQDRKPWSPNREFISQGAANVASAVSGGFPVGGSFSRSSINRLAGGHSRWSGAITGIAVLLFLPVAGIALFALPRAILGTIVIVAVIKLIRVIDLVRLIHYSRAQAIVGWSTFAFTLALAPNIEWAIVIGVTLATLVHVWREIEVQIDVHYEDETLRFEPRGVLFFASAPALDEALVNQLAAHPSAERLVIDLKKLGRIDYSGMIVLKRVAEEAELAGLGVKLIDIPPQSRRILMKVFGNGSRFL